MKKTKFNIAITICLIVVCLSLILAGCGNKRKPDDIVGEYVLDRVVFTKPDKTQETYYIKDIDSIENAELKNLVIMFNERRYEITTNPNNDGYIYYTKALTSTGAYARVEAEYITSVTFDKEYDYQYILNMEDESTKSVADLDGEIRIYRQIYETIDRTKYYLVRKQGYESAGLYFVKQDN